MTAGGVIVKLLLGLLAIGAGGLYVVRMRRGRGALAARRAKLLPCEAGP
jgi:hypothetical protein